MPSSYTFLLFVSLPLVLYTSHLMTLLSIDKETLSVFSLSSIFTKNDDVHSIAKSTNVSEFLQLMLPVVKEIVSLPQEQLQPSPTTNALFTSLVSLICVDNLRDDEISNVLTHQDILHYQQSLMEQCSSAEYYLEATFAREVQSGAKSVEDFLYYDNYVSLVQFEAKKLKMYANNASITRAAVIGAGPLPLTSVELLKHLPATAVIFNYDHSEEAIQLAKVVVNNDKRNLVEHRTALEISADDLRNVDLVYLAALVGIDRQEKMNILNHLYNVMRPGSILVARSAIGLKTLVYRRLTPEEFGKFSNIQEFHPTDKKVLNSIMCGTR